LFINNTSYNIDHIENVPKPMLLTTEPTQQWKT
jgi:hypothetical protein